ncbi:hypothetical protein Pst134EA_019155 [Puccinia striiformis f. sp. tritici]|uniref:hypothetical protein n=1 Tax=Puccinia striiformis f. sp. tritici TaxID=168172 RepID=UPI0020074D2A|nr:hypothetical protein Pst134EA_019155 [Puccinia striiformis f. sp. tritici]KAH9459003.1 hypothetical protein Pst134EA_019155 [Puccinia striiformis f. sp. tritici]
MQQGHVQGPSHLPHTWNTDPAEAFMEMNIHTGHQSPLSFDPGDMPTRVVDVDVNNSEGFGVGADPSKEFQENQEDMDDWISNALAGGMFDESVEQAGQHNQPDRELENHLDNSSWFPFRAKEYFVATLMLGSLHNLLSRTFYHYMRLVITLFNIQLPHWDSIRRNKERIRKFLEIHIIKNVTVFNNTCYSLSLKGLIAYELANPLVRKHMEFYPHDTKGKFIQSLCQSAKWREHLAREYRVQMVPHGMKHFYIFEPVTLYGHSNQLVVPIFFYKNEKGVFHAKCVYPKLVAPQNQMSTKFDVCIRSDIQYDSPDVVDFKVSDFDKIASEIRMNCGSMLLSLCDSQMKEYQGQGRWGTIQIPNPWRIRANGKVIRHVPITLYADDTSGNISKRWNKHVSFYFTLSGLPPEMTNMEYNCHFITTSNLASAVELVEPIVHELNELSTQGSIAYDCHLQQEVMFMCIPLAFLGDSPMAAEMTNTPNPGKANNPCRTCHLKAAKIEDRCSIEFVQAFFAHPDMPLARDWQQTKTRSHELWEVSQKNKAEFKQKTLEYGLKDNVTHKLIELQSQNVHEVIRIDEIIRISSTRLTNPTLEMNAFDGCKDTPVEILHVVLLGVVKYTFLDFMKRLDKKQLNLLEARLRSFNCDSLNIPNIQASYMMAHYKAFIGKDYRTILQLAPFVLFPFMTNKQKHIWFSMCYLSSLAFQTEIADMDSYISELEGVIRQFMYHISKMSGRWSNKPKFHMLLHLPQSIRRFGPASLFATEKFESYNSILRTLAIHSNRQAPSRDLANYFSDAANMRILQSGTYLKDHDKGHYFQASSEVRSMFDKNPMMQKCMGYNSEAIASRVQYPCLHNHKVHETDLEGTPEDLTNAFRNHDFREFRQVSAVKLNAKETIRKGTFIVHTNHNGYLLNSFSHHAPDYHRLLAGLRPSHISHEEMTEALNQGLENWRSEAGDDDDSD